MKFKTSVSKHDPLLTSIDVFVFELERSAETEKSTSKKKKAYSRIPDDSKPSLKDYEHRKEVKPCLFPHKIVK
jgi:hypothetical protein